jgi:hypothetical protein
MRVVADRGPAARNAPNVEETLLRPPRVEHTGADLRPRAVPVDQPRRVAMPAAILGS